jgi:ATP-dependent Clp protease ATP-binding subunit ClpA
VERLSVTLRSLDLRPDRPNAVVLLAGEVASYGHLVAETLAKGIAGSPERTVTVDLSTLIEPWDVRMLLGAKPPKTAAHAAHSLHVLIDAPWSVVLFENVEGCHPHVRTTITRALEAGYFADVTGRKIHLSDAIVVFTAPTMTSEPKTSLGFVDANGGRRVHATAATADILGRDLTALVDLVITKVRTEPAEDLTRRQLFSDLVKRYRTRGLEITWDPALIEWTRAEAQRRTPEQWNEWVDRSLAAALIPHLPAKHATKHVIVGQDGGKVVVAVSRAVKARGR